jgi:hypothetical protein
MRKTQGVFEGIPMMGTVCITIRDATTRAVKKRFEIRNKITFKAADLLVELIAQRVAGDQPPLRNSIFSMRIGSSNTAATRSDYNLGAFTIGKEIGDVGKVTGAPGEIKFFVTLDAGDANGTTLREAGLFTRGDEAVPTPSDPVINNDNTTPRMFAHQVYPDVPKTAAIVVDYTWTIAFTAVP